MKSIKCFFVGIITILFLFLCGNNNAIYAAEVPMEQKIIADVQKNIDSGKLPRWHSTYINDPGYQAYYFKEVMLNGDLDYYASLRKEEILKLNDWYKNYENQTWDTIFKNLDIEAEFLEKDKYLGLYWDSVLNNQVDDGYLYLIWTTKYIPSEFLTIKQLAESGKKYSLYDNKAAEENLEGNFLDTMSYHFKKFDLSIHATPIGGFFMKKEFGLPLKQIYNFEGLTYGIDDAQFGVNVDPSGDCNGIINQKLKFDLGLVPAQDGKNSMQLVTHGYEIIKECQVQSYFDLNFGGYIHQVLFNTTINIDRIYRVDVDYKLTNDDKPWYQFFLPSEEHEIQKSLTSKRVTGGFLGLSKYQGFKQGSFQSTETGSKNFKYKLILDYDADAWNWFKGREFCEADYRKVSKFKILRMNYLVDGKTYDVPIKMDTVDGETLFIADPDLILDTDKPYYDFKKGIDDLFRDMKAKYEEYKPIILTIVGIVGSSLLIYLIYKAFIGIKIMLALGNNKHDDE